MKRTHNIDLNILFLCEQKQMWMGNYDDVDWWLIMRPLDSVDDIGKELTFSFSNLCYVWMKVDNAKCLWCGAVYCNCIHSNSSYHQCLCDYCLLSGDYSLFSSLLSSFDINI